MNVDQVINGIARAVKSVEPTQEYCFLGLDCWITCMTKSEWAAWAQFSGSVLAIYWASKIATRQFINSEVVKEEGACRQLLHFFGQMHLFYEQWNAVVSSISSGKFDQSSLANFRSVLQESLSIARAVSLENLSSEWATACIFARSTAVQIVVVIETMEEWGVEYESEKKTSFEKSPDISFYFKNLISLERDYYKRLRELCGDVVNFKGDLNFHLSIMKSNMHKKSRFFSPDKLENYFNMNPIK